MKILIIDDNESITSMFSRMLKMEGHECIVSNNGRNGLELLEQQKFDATILDIAMPEFSGLEVIDTLEKNGKLKEQKVIVLTASSGISPEKVDELKKRGVYAFLKKPVRIDNLLSTLEN